MHIYAFDEITLLGIKIKRDAADQMPVTILNTIECDSNIDIESEDNISDVELDSNESNSDVNTNAESCEFEPNLLEDLNVLCNVNGSLDLRNYNNKTILNPDSPFICIQDSSNNNIVVRKSSICWLLNKNNFTLSSDRLQRVKDCELEKSKNQSREEIKFTKVCNEVEIGDYCLFTRLDNHKKCYLGLVLAFAYLEGKTWKSTEFSSDYANVKENGRNVGVLCQWYFLEKNLLKPLP